MGPNIQIKQFRGRICRNFVNVLAEGTQHIPEVLYPIFKTPRI